MRRTLSIRSRIAAAASWVLLGAALVRCSLFVDTDGLSSGVDADGSTFDAFTEDGRSAGDTGADAGNPSDAVSAVDAPFSCDGSHSICDDFDTAAFGARWSSSFVQGAGSTLALSSETAVSPPQSLHGIIGDAGGSSSFEKDFSVMPTRVHCELQTLVRTGTHQVLAWYFPATAAGINDYHVQVLVGENNPNLAYVTDFLDGGNDYRTAAIPSLVNGAWTPVTLDLTPTDGGSLLTVTVNNATSSAVTVRSPAPAGTTLGAITLGENYTDRAADAFYDNVLCDVTP